MNDALIAVLPGHLGAVVTFLEMSAPPAPAALPDSPLRLARWEACEPGRYRDLFARVGARWLWFSRLAMGDEELLAKAGEIHEVLGPEGESAGMIELDFSSPGRCQIRFLGLVPELAGLGHGRWLVAAALALAWRPGVGEVGIHTCSLDHPAALPAYLRAGFTAYARAFETFPDPRLAGLLPRDAAPQVPFIG